ACSRGPPRRRRDGQTPAGREHPETGAASPASLTDPPGRSGLPPRSGGWGRRGVAARTPPGSGKAMPANDRTAVLFPGQGSQTDDMRDSAARLRPDLVARAAEIVGEDPFARVEDGTRFQQPALFCASVAGYGTLDLQPDAAAGHSLGEFGALAVAGALDETDALELVALRGELMDAAACE